MGEERKIIVSCTTTKNRLDLLYYMIESLKKQTLRPNVVYINISSEPSFLGDEGITEAPTWFDQNFIRINWIKDIGPYGKLLPIIRQVNNDDLIITADDDVLYHSEWLNSLVTLADDYPDNIVCARGREIKKNIFGNWQGYYNWKRILHREQGMLILPTGTGGVVYRKSLLDLDFLLDPAFQKIAPTADDLWFRMASLRKNVPVYVCPEIDQKNVYLKHERGLEQMNFERKKNYKARKKNNPAKRLKGWFGFKVTKNDKAWFEISEYSSLHD